MQKHTINELYEMLKGIMDDGHPGNINLCIPPVHQTETISLSVIHKDIAFNFVLADENGFIASSGELVKWDDATPEDMARAVEFADNWLNDKSGEA
ncbi:MAG: hypothetical protein IKA48_00610 [Fibrobacter sp.]|nr:hypothetical protein [Fibrobacter sp.]